MATIGHKHFLDNIEALPGETVVWEGGASKTGIIVQILWMTAALVLIVGMFGFLSSIPEIFYTENPDSVAQEDTGIQKDNAATEKETAPESAADETKTGASVGAVDKNHPYILNTGRVYRMIAVFIPLIVLLMVVSAWYRVRHYWFVVTTERICIQSGIFTRKLATLDIDKVVSVVSTHTPIDRLFRVHSVEVIHAGVNAMGPNNGLILFNPYKMSYVPVSTNLVGQLLNNWLPRDNRTKQDK